MAEKEKELRDEDLPPANYGNATPEDVARALLRRRPKGQQYFDEDDGTPEKEEEYFDDE